MVAPLPITGKDCAFLLNGEEVIRVTEFKGEVIRDKEPDFIECLKPKVFTVTGRFTFSKNPKIKRYQRYIKRCNRWRSKNNLKLLRWWI